MWKKQAFPVLQDSQETRISSVAIKSRPGNSGYLRVRIWPSAALTRLVKGGDM